MDIEYEGASSRADSENWSAVHLCVNFHFQRRLYRWIFGLYGTEHDSENGSRHTIDKREDEGIGFYLSDEIVGLKLRIAHFFLKKN